MDASRTKDLKDLKPVALAAKQDERAKFAAPAQGWPDFAAAMRRVEAEVYDVA
jgi:hypothetical protein